jgi:hypothetical protein
MVPSASPLLTGSTVSVEPFMIGWVGVLFEVDEVGDAKGRITVVVRKEMLRLGD